MKCKQPTETNNETNVVSKNGRLMKKGFCVICGSRKSRFIKDPKKGKGLLNDFITNLPVEMHMPGHNFTGPGTKLKQRLNPDLTPKANSKPVNRVDKAAMHHDICYVKNKDTKTRNNVCDRNMITEMKNIINPTLRERIERGIVSRIIGTKMNFGMGY
jgi:hypothetical protein|tara:strand:- start:3195 stop:3668 length:474 start_codon:yes stop_codon:yes gene_type:complete